MSGNLEKPAAAHERNKFTGRHICVSLAETGQFDPLAAHRSHLHVGRKAYIGDQIPEIVHMDYLTFNRGSTVR